MAVPKIRIAAFRDMIVSFFLFGATAPVGQELLILLEVSRSHTTTQHSQ